MTAVPQCTHSAKRRSEPIVGNPDLTKNGSDSHLTVTHAHHESKLALALEFPHGRLIERTHSLEAGRFIECAYCVTLRRLSGIWTSQRISALISLTTTVLVDESTSAIIALTVPGDLLA